MNARSGIAFSIPGYGDRKIQIFVTDYTGTLACGLVSEVQERLHHLRDVLNLRVITADSFGAADEELLGIVTPYRLREARHDVEKEQYVKGFDAEHVVAFGNGNNDRFMLRAVKNGGGIAVAIDNGEGCRGFPRDHQCLDRALFWTAADLEKKAPRFPTVL
jgi:soluble P-type ATPase